METGVGVTLDLWINVGVFIVIAGVPVWIIKSMSVVDKSSLVSLRKAFNLILLIVKLGLFVITKHIKYQNVNIKNAESA
jgi:hypothetical protein